MQSWFIEKEYNEQLVMSACVRERKGISSFISSAVENTDVVLFIWLGFFLKAIEWFLHLV